MTVWKAFSGSDLKVIHIFAVIFCSQGLDGIIATSDSVRDPDNPGNNLVG